MRRTTLFVLTGSQAIPEDEIKNGTTPFSVMTVAPETPIAGAPDCPNPQWTEDITASPLHVRLADVERPRAGRQRDLYPDPVLA